MYLLINQLNRMKSLLLSTLLVISVSCFKDSVVCTEGFPHDKYYTVFTFSYRIDSLQQVYLKGWTGVMDKIVNIEIINQNIFLWSPCSCNSLFYRVKQWLVGTH
jgi:hypothetical protein